MAGLARSAPRLALLALLVACGRGGAEPRALSARPTSDATTDGWWDDPPGEPPGFRFVDNFELDGDGGVVTSFSGRPYAISLNVAIPQHARLRPALAWRLHAAGQVEQVVVEEFGGEPRTRLELHIGDLVPVPVAQAVLDVYGHRGGLPVHAGVAVVDLGFGDRARIYVGALVELVDQPLTPARLDALLRPGLTAAELHDLLPVVPDDADGADDDDAADAP